MAGTTEAEYALAGDRIPLRRHQVIAEKKGETWTDYIFPSASLGTSFGGQRIAQNTGTSLSTARFLHTDHLGSTRLCTNSSGSSAGTCDYEPFGEFRGTCSVPTAFRFAGMQWDEDTGLYHTWFREYDATQGRWLSVDPLAGEAGDPQSFDRYVYALNSPIELVDPLGLSANCIYITGVTASILVCPPWPGGGMGTSGTGTPGMLLDTGNEDGTVGIFAKVENWFKKAAETACKAVPDARVDGLAGGMGSVGAVVGSVQRTIDYNKGNVTGTASTGMFVGWNGVVSGTVFAGFVWGSQPPDKTGSTTVSRGQPISPNVSIGGFASLPSGGLDKKQGGPAPDWSGPVTAGVTGSVSLVGGVPFGAAATNSTQPVSLGSKIWHFTAADWLLYGAKQACK